MPGGVIESRSDAGRTIIVFRVADNLFGVDVENITEVIEPTHITRVPLVNNTILGAINVRGLIVPVIDMSRRLYDCEMTVTASARIFICEVTDDGETVKIGGMVDAVVSVNDIAEVDISDSPEFGSKLRSEFISGVGKADDRFIMLLDMHRVFDIDDLSNQAMPDVYGDENLAIKSQELDDESVKRVLNTMNEEVSVEKQTYILFAIGSETYGVDMGRVQEVVRVGEMERLPNAMPFMKGVMNIRGVAVPLVDMRLRCALPEKDYTADTSVLIIHAFDVPVGLIVDDVTDVLEIPVTAVQDTFHYSAQIDRDFISGIAGMAGKFIVLVNTDRILTDEEFKKLKKMQADTITG